MTHRDSFSEENGLTTPLFSPNLTGGLQSETSVTGGNDMELQQAWMLVDFYLEQIIIRTKELRQNAAASSKVSETPIPGTCVLDEIDIAEKELTEALRLSKSANERLQNMYSHRRKGIQDGQRTARLEQPASLEPV
jgi:DNA invertase Pin-like site-specific DNA recombinase